MKLLTKEKSIDFLRCAIGVFFVWSGLLKIINYSVTVLFIAKIFPIFPEPIFLHLFGIVEILIGTALLVRFLLPLTFVMIWTSNFFTAISALIFPTIFLSDNAFFVHMQSQSLIQVMLVFVASLVVASHELRSLCLIHHRKGHYWFKPYKIGFFALYYPVRFPGYVVTVSTIMTLVSFFLLVDTSTYSSFGALIALLPCLIICLLIYDVFTRVTGLYPWWWKKRCDCKSFY